jgi:hypothetical protein
MVPWSPEEKASTTFGMQDGDKNSSTSQELKCLVAAPLQWVDMLKPQTGNIFSYGTDADNLTHLLARMRSNTPAVNRLLAILGWVLGKRGLHVRVCWRDRTHPSSRAADCLSRGDVASFQAAMPEHPSEESGILTSIQETIRGSLSSLGAC